MQCDICGNEAEFFHYNKVGDFKSAQTIECSYCGSYNKEISFIISNYTDKSNFYKVSSWIREQNDLFGSIPFIDHKKFEEILNMRDKKIKEKFDLMMHYLVDCNLIEQLDEQVLSKCWIKDLYELNNLFQKALNQEYVQGHTVTRDPVVDDFPIFNGLTFDGLQYLEELENPNKNSKKIFVAFNFNEPLTSIFNTNLKEAIESEGFEYVVVNQDNVEHNKSINDEIIVKLKTSRVVIADFTNHRNSVYFEAGFAMGMNIPIIWTCQKGHEDDMSFDTRQFPHIVWEDKDDLVKQVIDRINRIL